MGNGPGIGGLLTALLQGASQGFVEAETADKLKQEKEKTAVKQRRFDMAKLVFKDPAATPEAKQLSLQVIGGSGTGKVASDFDQFVALGSMTQETEGRTASALPQGEAQGPAIDVNQEGKIEQGQPQVFEGDEPAAAGPAPIPLEAFSAPPETGPTQEALDRKVIIEPTTREIPLFKSAEDIAAEKGNLDLIRKTPVLDDAERRKQVTAEKKSIRESEALRRSVEAVLGEGQDADRTINLIIAGMTGNEAFEQGGLDKKPSRVQRRTFTRAALKSAFFGLATIDEATGGIPDSDLFTAVELKGLRDEALLDRRNKQRIAAGRQDVSFKEAGKTWNTALGRAQAKQVRDPNEIIATFIPLAGVALEEQIDVEILKLGFNPDQVRQLVERPFEEIQDRTGELSGAANRAIEGGTAVPLPEFRPVPSHTGVETQVNRKGANPIDVARELFIKDLEK